MSTYKIITPHESVVETNLNYSDALELLNELEQQITDKNEHAEPYYRIVEESFHRNSNQI